MNFHLSRKASRPSAFAGDDIFRDERIVVDPVLQIRHRDIVRQDPAARIGLEAADQQKNAVIEAALDPLLVAGHEFAGLPFVGRKSKQYDEHLISTPLVRGAPRCRHRKRASRTSALLPA